LVERDDDAERARRAERGCTAHGQPPDRVDEFADGVDADNVYLVRQLRLVDEV